MLEDPTSVALIEDPSDSESTSSDAIDLWHKCLCHIRH